MLTGIIDYCVYILGKGSLKAWRVPSQIISPQYYHNIKLETKIRLWGLPYKLYALPSSYWWGVGD